MRSNKRLFADGALSEVNAVRTHGNGRQAH